MARRKRFWTCTRQQDGKRCNTLVPTAKRKCPACGKAKPAARRPKHMIALNESYEHYVEINGGEHCGICGKPPDHTRRLDRDHSHDVLSLGTPRGLLCRGCNMRLSYQLTEEWMEAALAYLRRARERITDDEEMAV
jgi:hypothetical protein